MSSAKKRVVGIAVAVMVCVCLAVGAMGAMASDEGVAGSSASDDAQVQSLADLHVMGQLDGVTDFSNATCLTSGCHSRADLVEATQDYQGNVGFNPHANHMYYQCVDCYATEGPQILGCGEPGCHSDIFTPAEGWEFPATK